MMTSHFTTLHYRKYCSNLQDSQTLYLVPNSRFAVSTGEGVGNEAGFALFTFSLASSPPPTISDEPSGEDIPLGLGNRAGLVERVHVATLSGHTDRGSVPWSRDREVPWPDEAALHERVLDPDSTSSWLDSDVPRPEDEAVWAELICRRSSSISVFWFSTRSSRLKGKRGHVSREVIKNEK